MMEADGGGNPFPVPVMDIITQAEADAYLRDQLKDEAPSAGTPASMITDVSRRLAQFTGRQDWGSQIARTEYYNGDSQFLLVNVWPIISVTGIFDDTDHVWDASSELDANSYWIGQNSSLELNNGTIFSHNGKFTSGYQNLKVVYVGGYSDTTTIPDRIKEAALMQIAHDIRINGAMSFNNVPRELDGTRNDPMYGVGLLSQVRYMLTDFIRRVPFA